MVATRLPRLLPALLLFAAFAANAIAQVPEALFGDWEWRLVGPFRGGRVAAVCGVEGNRDTYWFGSTGGGVWKTGDAGKTWQNVSDGSFGGSIGAVAVAPSKPDTVYVGGGEKTWRGNVSSGDGIWKTTDGGKTWEFCGLPDSRHISRIRIHPRNPDLVYAAVMGHVSGPNDERGVYRSKDGGANWERVLFANADAGAVDLCLDASDPQVLYATTWRAVRTPWSFSSGGDGSGLWKSTDGGDTWQALHGRPGLPSGVLGICGIASAPSRPQCVYALVEAQDGGLFCSEDGGATWSRRSDDAELRQRAWYYTRLNVDPTNHNVVYVLNVGFHRSSDGGRSFTSIRVPHSDNHDLWIDPKDPQRWIEGNDGGACVTTDGGKSWSSQDNQPTAQFYRVTTDNAVPYRIYGAQQDNSTVRIRHRSRGRGIGRSEWESTAGGESGWLAPHPADPEIVFGGSYGGYLQRLDHRLSLSRNVTVWPDNPIGAGAGEQKYRFQWNFPIQWSRHEKGVLYTAAQVLFASRDEGQSWQVISPDLTRNDPSKLGSSGGPITQDNTSVEYYGTIFAFDEGRVPGTLWCGSDDGRVQVSRDGGKSWRDVTPPSLPEWAQINCIAHNPFVDGGCYVAATRYKLDDFRPYVLVTEDYGATWHERSGGLDPYWFVRCVRPDPEVPGLLYCGTERTVWISYNDGRRWQRFARGLPLVPITDLCVRDNALIAATQGRSFWSFDGLPQVREVDAEDAVAALFVFTPVPVVLGGGSDELEPGAGQNPPRDLKLCFHLGVPPHEPLDELEIVVRDFDGRVVWQRKTGDQDKPLKIQSGSNTLRITWDEEAPKVLDGMVLWNGRGGAPRRAPGDYPIEVRYGVYRVPVVARVLPDPRSPASIEELQARYRLVARCRDVVTAAHTAIERLRSLRTQVAAVVERSEGAARERLVAAQQAFAGSATAIEEALYQTKAKSSQDVLNFPIRLTDKLLGVLSAVNSAEYGPTEGQRAVAEQLIVAIEQQLAAFERLQQAELVAFNQLALELAVPHVK